MTRLFANLEMRGVDASGVWASESGQNGRIFYNKEPIKSSCFVKSDFWDLIENYEIDLLLAHARGATKGKGHPLINKNNHPFVSQDCRLALVHNGVIYESDYLKKQYQTQSDCDSEVLLRIYESICSADRHLWLQGVKEIWSLVRKGHMAVAIGERHENNDRTLCLFRNDKRPLWIADLRDDLGQIFFFSSIEIWEKAIEECKSHVLHKGHVVFEIAPQEAWYFTLDNHISYKQYEISMKFGSHNWIPGKFQPIIKPKMNLEVITELNQDNELIEFPHANIHYQNLENQEMMYFEDLLDNTGEDLKDALTSIYNSWVEGSLSDYQINVINNELWDIKGIIDNLNKILEK